MPISIQLIRKSCFSLRVCYLIMLFVVKYVVNAILKNQSIGALKQILSTQLAIDIGY